MSAKSQIPNVQTGHILFWHHQMKRVLEVLSNNSVNDSLPIYLLINVQSERSLSHCPDLLPHLDRLNLVMGHWMNRQHFLEKFKRDLNPTFLHWWQDVVDTLLTQPVKTLVPGEWLFSLFKYFTTHIYEFYLVRLISLQELPHTLRNQDYLSLGSCHLPNIKQPLQIVVKSIELLQTLEFLFIYVGETLVFWPSEPFLLELLFPFTLSNLELCFAFIFTLLLSFLLTVFLFILFGLCIFLSVLVLSLWIFIIQNDLLIHLWKVGCDKLFFHILVFTLFLLVLDIVAPLKVFMLFQQRNEKSSTVLVVWNYSHWVLKSYLSCLLLSDWRKQGWLYFRTLCILIFLIKAELSFGLTICILFFILDDTTNFPV